MELYCRDSYGTLIEANLPKIEILHFLGYSLGCFVLPTFSESRLIWGLDGVLVKMDGFSVIITFSPQRWYWAGLIFALEVTNYIDAIKSVELNGNLRESVLLEDLYDGGVLKLTFHDIDACIDACSSIYYLISPFRDGSYYLNYGLENHNKI